MSVDSYYAKMLYKTCLPGEICDLIIEFADENVPIVCNKQNAPLKWFSYSIKFKKMSEIKHEYEIDTKWYNQRRTLTEK
jgi:hypothetical protein